MDHQQKNTSYWVMKKAISLIYLFANDAGLAAEICFEQFWIDMVTDCIFCRSIDLHPNSRYCETQLYVYNKGGFFLGIQFSRLVNVGAFDDSWWLLEEEDPDEWHDFSDDQILSVIVAWSVGRAVRAVKQHLVVEELFGKTLGDLKDCRTFWTCGYENSVYMCVFQEKNGSTVLYVIQIAPQVFDVFVATNSLDCLYYYLCHCVNRVRAR